VVGAGAAVAWAALGARRTPCAWDERRRMAVPPVVFQLRESGAVGGGATHIWKISETWFGHLGL
jgi:hypothetical protein